MLKFKIMSRFFVLTGLLMFLLAGTCDAASTYIYYDGGTLSVSNPDIEVSKIYGIKLSPINVSVPSKSKAVYIAHRLENMSNDANKIILRSSSISNREWPFALIIDDNGDGIHQESEESLLNPDISLGEGADLHFFLKITRPNNAALGDKCLVEMVAACSVKDGSAYVGDNGLHYGGADEIKCVDSFTYK